MEIKCTYYIQKMHYRINCDFAIYFNYYIPNESKSWFKKKYDKVERCKSFVVEDESRRYAISYSQAMQILNGEGIEKMAIDEFKSTVEYRNLVGRNTDKDLFNTMLENVDSKKEKTFTFTILTGGEEQND